MGGYQIAELAPKWFVLYKGQLVTELLEIDTAGRESNPPITSVLGF